MNKIILADVLVYLKYMYNNSHYKNIYFDHQPSIIYQYIDWIHSQDFF